jgi:3-oxoacyl-[acyl-carrier protein] reductase
MSDSTLDGKVVLVTGAGSTIGLGRAMTLALVGAGARVAMMDRDATSLAESAEDARKVGGPNCVCTIVGDVTQHEDAERVAQEAIAQMGDLHVLLNNAGINPQVGPGEGPAFARIAVDDWTRTMQVNINGPFFMARAAVGHLLARGWGRIIGVTTSLDTMFGAPYGVSKAAHEAFIAAMSRQLEGTGVTANVLIPGRAVNTNMTAGRGDPTTRLEPEIMQSPILWLASEDADGFNGRRIIAELWNEDLPIDQRLERSSAPAAWPQLGRQSQGERLRP